MHTLIANFAARNIQAWYEHNLTAARARIMKLLPGTGTVGIGNSKTLKDMDLTSALTTQGYIVMDKTFAVTKEEGISLKKQALLADWYISSSNAVSQEGHIVNIDHSGNRAAALIYGPERVIIVVGKNKIVPTLDDAIKRARNWAAPRNAIRAGMNPPCTTSGFCVDCRHPQRVCNNLIIIEGQSDPQRMKIIIVGEDLGF